MSKKQTLEQRQDIRNRKTIFKMICGHVFFFLEIKRQLLLKIFPYPIF